MSEGLMESAHIPVASEYEIDAPYCLHFLRQIRDVAFATVDAQGLPSVRVIDIMHEDGKRLYFLTPRGKAFHEELLRSVHVAIVGQTTDFGTCRLRGPVVRPEGEAEQRRLVDWLFELNPGMSDLYPGESRYIIDVFYIEKGEGEYFDLGQKPILRVPFTLGDLKEDVSGYFITEVCTGCGRCAKACPQHCISQSADGNYEIRQRACMRCWICVEICGFGAVRKLG